MLCHELVVLQVRVCPAHAVDLVHLSWRQVLVRVETPAAFEESLAAKNFVQSGDAAREVVPRVEHGRIRIGE
jgi:hypothetical protein